MSTEKRVTFNEYGEPVVVITIKGWDDAFRFAWAMGHLQCDFSDVARRIAGSLRRHMGSKNFGEFQHRYTSRTSLKWVRDDEDEPVLVPQPVAVSAREQLGDSKEA